MLHSSLNELAALICVYFLTDESTQISQVKRRRRRVPVEISSGHETGTDTSHADDETENSCSTVNSAVSGLGY